MIRGKFTARLQKRRAGLNEQGYAAASIVYIIFSAIMLILAFRLLFSLLGANPANMIANFVYSTSAPLVAPFFGLFTRTPQLGISGFEFEIVVVDDASTDTTVDLVRQFISKHQNRSIRLIAKRKNKGRGAAVDTGLRYAKGELVMTLDADCLVDKYALRNAVRHFADQKTAAMASNIRINEAQNLISLIQQFDYLVGFRAKKFNTISNAEYMVGGAGATYRRDVLKQLKGFDHTMKTEDIEIGLRIAKLIGNKVMRIKYGSDVVIATQAVPSYKSLFLQRYRWKFGSLQAMFKHRSLLFSTSRHHSKLLTVIRLPLLLWSEVLLLLEPVFFTYFAYLAIVNNNATLFISACLALTVLLLITIWSDEHLRTKTKLKLSGYAPIMYLAFYVLTYIQVLAAVKCLFNLTSLTGIKKIQGSYVSPERVAT